MIPRCSNMADPKRPIKLHRKQNKIHAVKVLLKSGMSEYSQTCYKILTDIQIAFKHQSNSLKCLRCALYKDSVSQSWYDFLSCNLKEVKIEFIYGEDKPLDFLLYFIFYYLSPFITHSLCSFRFCSDFLVIMFFPWKSWINYYQRSLCFTFSKQGKAANVILQCVPFPLKRTIIETKTY